jgi:hypothetical protein
MLSSLLLRSRSQGFHQYCILSSLLHDVISEMYCKLYTVNEDKNFLITLYNCFLKFSCILVFYAKSDTVQYFSNCKSCI